MTSWQPLALISGMAVGTAAGAYAAHSARTALSESSSDVGGRDRARLADAATVIVGAAAGAAVGARFGFGVELAAYLLLVAVALPLSAIDVAARKVPDRILLPAVPAAIALLALAAHSTRDFGALGRALLVGVATFVAYLLLALGTGQLGFGDCKAAGFCGLYLGYLGAKPAALGVVFAFVMAAVVAVISRTRRASGGNRTLAFAPYIFAGALLVITIH